MPETGSRGANNEHTTPFVEIPRSYWADLAPSTTLPLTPTEIVALSGLGEMLSLREVSEVYLPLSKLLTLYAVGAQQLHRSTSGFLKRPSESTPFVIGVAGSVAVGKSTISRLLRELLSRWEDTPRVELLTTDGFLLPNAELERRGLMDRKGFPESYDRRALLRFVSKVKSGAAEVRAPFYSHLSYDISPGAEVVMRQPDILIVEGLNVLQPPHDGAGLAISDLFDFTIYVDARTSDIATWYEERFLKLQRGGVRQSAVVFPPLLDAEPRGGAGQGARHLEAHQRTQPDRQHPADPVAGDAGAAQEREARGEEHPVAQDLTARRSA